MVLFIGRDVEETEQHHREVEVALHVLVRTPFFAHTRVRVLTSLLPGPHRLLSDLSTKMASFLFISFHFFSFPSEDLEPPRRCRRRASVAVAVVVAMMEGREEGVRRAVMVPKGSLTWPAK
jgi:hypothetical protein